MEVFRLDFRLEMQLLHCVICPFSVVSNRSKWDEVELKLLKELHAVVLWAKGFVYMAVDAFFFTWKCTKWEHSGHNVGRSSDLNVDLTSAHMLTEPSATLKRAPSKYRVTTLETRCRMSSGGLSSDEFPPGGVGNAAVGLMVFFNSTRSRKLHHKVSHRSRSNNMSLTEARINVYVTVCW